MIELHRLPPETFDSLAGTGGGPPAIDLLLRTRRSRAMLMLRYIADRDPTLKELTSLLAAAQAAAPGAVSTLMSYPWVGVWLSRVLGRGWCPHDRRHFTAIVAAAVLRAGLQISPPAVHPAKNLRIVIPTLGALAARGATPVRLTSAHLRGRDWHGLRTIADQTHRLVPQLTVDDLDPNRDCHGFPAAHRLDARTWGSWKSRLYAALDLLATYSGDRHAELMAGLSSVVPLRASKSAAGLSATHPDAFGGFACSLPSTAAELAAAMVHEFQHSKLHALTQLASLCTTDDRRFYFAPWRPDPRPLMGALHGAYAFVAVAELWNSLRAEPGLELQATAQFALLRAQLKRVLPDLVAAPALTPAGRRFTITLAARAEELARHGIPRHLDRSATCRVNELEREWRDRNHLTP